MEPPNNPIGSAIEQAQPVNPHGQPDPYGDRRADKYALQNGIVYLLKPSFNRETKTAIEIPIALTVNFCARLTEEILLDDGLEVRANFLVEGRTTSGQALPPVIVPAAGFNGLGWVTTSWGSRAILAAGPTVKDHFRTALMVLSGKVPRKTVFTHTGWRRLDGEWLYLTGSGAINAAGLREDIHVDLGHGNVSKFSLPTPPPGRELQSAAGHLLDLLDLSPSRPELGAALFACVVRAVLGEAHPCDFSLFLAGRSGAQKSEAVALAQACFGSGFSARSFPAGWHDTPADLEHKSHQSKDAVFVVDDFAPSVNQSEAARLHTLAERLFRSVGNQSGRGRRNADLTAKPAYSPRALILATGEDLPRGASLLGRLLVIEVRRGEIDLAALSRLQQAAREGTLAAGMAGFVRWLAPRMDELKSTFPRLVRTLRDQTLADGHARSHPRAAEMLASLTAGVSIFLDFAVEARAVIPGEAVATENRIEAALLSAFLGQAEFQRDSDEVDRFLSLLRACLSSGNGHVADHLNQGPPAIRPHSWGWRDQGDDALKPMGDVLGWLNAIEGAAWINPESAFAAVQRMAKVQGEPLLISAPSLWRRLHERGLLGAVEQDSSRAHPRPTIKRAVGGRKVRVLVMAASLFDDPE